MHVDRKSFFCRKPVGKYGHLCTKKKGHKGRCSQNGVGSILKKHKALEKPAKKLLLDAYETPGNGKCFKNRANRCYPVRFTKEQARIANEKGQRGVAIPVRFASTPEDCFSVHIDMAVQILAIKGLDLSVFGANKIDLDDQAVIKMLIEEAQREHPAGLRCRICKEPIQLCDFDTEPSSRAEHSIQIGHINPKINGLEETAHVAGNVQWIHRDCNVMQGDKTEEELLEKCRLIYERGTKGWL